eukprot:15273915-Ditylum_brightwellii.AAC.1
MPHHEPQHKLQCKPQRKRTDICHPMPATKNFLALGLSPMGHQNGHAGTKTKICCYKAWFGSEPVFVMMVWTLLVKSNWLDYGCQVTPVHLLWAFMFLKGYSTEEINAGKAGVDKKTYCKRVWFCIEGIANLDNLL